MAPTGSNRRRAATEEHGAMSPLDNQRRRPQQASLKPERIRDPAEKAFVQTLQSCEAYVRLEQELGTLIAEGASLEGEFGNLLQPLCRAGWEECKRSLCENSGTDAEIGLYAAARADADALKKQMHELNLNCLKQVTTLKNGTFSAEQFGDETVTFYEPMRHLDPEVQELVQLIVAEKIQQLQDGTAPNSLVASIVKAVKAAPKKRQGGGDESASELRGLVCELEEDVEALKVRLVDAEASAAGNVQLLQAAAEAAIKAESRHGDLVGQVSQLTEELAQSSSEQQEAKNRLNEAEASLRDATSRLEEAARLEKELKDRVDEVELQLKSEREANAGNAEKVDALEAEVKEATAAGEELRRRVGELEALQREELLKVAKLEQEVAELRAELEQLRRKSSTRSYSTQTSLTGEQVAGHEDEIKRLKVALEELRAKLGELMTECKKTGMSEAQMDAIADTCGLKPLLKARSVFENLYQDAIRRVDRLEKLKEKYRLEREKNLPPGYNPHALGRQSNQTPQAHGYIDAATIDLMDSSFDDTRELSVLEAVQQSSISDVLPRPPPPPPRPQRRLLSDEAVNLKPPRSMLSDSVEAPVGPFIERGLTAFQRAQMLKGDPPRLPERIVHMRQPPEPLQSAVRALVPPLPPGGPTPSAPAKGGPSRLAFAPTPRDLGAEAGGELARRLVTSSSLPALSHQMQQTSALGPATGGAGGAFSTRSGLTNVIGGRDAGWK